MWPFGPKRVRCPAGRWTTIIKTFGSAYHEVYRVTFETPGLPEGSSVQGTYSEQRSLWIFPGETSEGDLHREMEFTRQWINTWHRVRILPEQDVIAVVD